MTIRTRSLSTGRAQRGAPTAEMDSRAVDLRSQGLSYRTIATELGVSSSTAHAAVSRALSAVLAQNVEHLREVEGLRLDRLTREVYGLLERPPNVVWRGKEVPGVIDYLLVLKAMRELRLISESRRRLLDLDLRRDPVSPSVIAEIEKLAFELGVSTG